MIEAIKVFISYASKNQEFANKTCTYLEERGKQCWIAPRNIAVGAEYGEEIIKGIEESNVFVLIFSEASNRSQHVLREVERAVSKNIPIISYRIDQSELSKSMEYFLLSNQWMDATTEPNVMLRRLDMSIDTLMNVKHEQEEEVIVEPKRESSVLHKAVPVLLGCIAVGVIAIAFILGTKLNHGTGTSKETTTVSSQQITAQENITPTIDEAVKSSESELLVQNDEDKKELTESSKEMVAEDTNDSKESEDTDQSNEDAALTDGVEKDKKEETSTEEKQESAETKEAATATEGEKESSKGEIEDVKDAGKNETKNDGKDEAKNDVKDKNNSKDEIKNEVQKENKEDSKPVTSEEKSPIADVLTGDYFEFAHYKPTGYSESNQDSEIIWQVIDVDQSTNTVRLITKNIIDIKPFDCAESGTFDKNSAGESYDRDKKDEYSAKELTEFRGSNKWSKSDLCAWLNSSGNVKYHGTAPSDQGTDEYGNGFNNQSGFLASFTKKERALLQENNLDDGAKNLVYILSMDEVKKYSNTDYFILHPQMTQSAIQSDKTSWYNAYKEAGAQDYIWVTRTGDKNYANSVYIVNSEIGKDTFEIKYAAASGFGIRPVITLSLNQCKVNGDGTEMSPYSIIME